jgi:hypothetical protein
VDGKVDFYDWRRRSIDSLEDAFPETFPRESMVEFHRLAAYWWYMNKAYREELEDVEHEENDAWKKANPLYLDKKSQRLDKRPDARLNKRSRERQIWFTVTAAELVKNKYVAALEGVLKTGEALETTLQELDEELDSYIEYCAHNGLHGDAAGIQARIFADIIMPIEEMKNRYQEVVNRQKR